MFLQLEIMTCTKTYEIQRRLEGLVIISEVGRTNITEQENKYSIYRLTYFCGVVTFRKETILKKLTSRHVLFNSTDFYSKISSLSQGLAMLESRKGRIFLCSA